MHPATEKRSAARITDAARQAYQRSFQATHDAGAALDAAGAVVARLAGKRTGFWDQETLTWTFDPLPSAQERAAARREGRQAAKDLAATGGMTAVQQSLGAARHWANEARRLGVADVEGFADAARNAAERLLSPALAPKRRQAIVARALEPLRRAFKAAAMRERKANAELTHALWSGSAPRSVGRYDADKLDRLDRAWDDTLNEYRGAMVALRMAVEEARSL